MRKSFEAGESSPPGGRTRYLPTNKVRAFIRAGLGEFQAVQLAVQRMQRTTDEHAPLPRRVDVVEDITKGLGLDHVDAARVHNLVGQTNVEFSPKTQTQRLTLARGALSDLLRSMKDLSGDTRMELAKRALAWWRKQDTDLRVIKGDGVRWITVSGARVGVGPDGKLLGDHGARLEAHMKRKRRRRAKEVVAGGYEGARKGLKKAFVYQPPQARKLDLEW